MRPYWQYNFEKISLPDAQGGTCPSGRHRPVHCGSGPLKALGRQATRPDGDLPGIHGLASFGRKPSIMPGPSNFAPFISYNNKTHKCTKMHIADTEKSYMLTGMSAHI